MGGSTHILEGSESWPPEGDYACHLHKQQRFHVTPVEDMVTEDPHHWSSLVSIPSIVFIF